MEDYLVGKRGRRLKFWGRKSKFKKNARMGKNIKLYGTLYTPVELCRGKGDMKAMRKNVTL